MRGDAEEVSDAQRYPAEGAYPAEEVSDARRHIDR